MNAHLLAHPSMISIVPGSDMSSTWVPATTTANQYWTNCPRCDLNGFAFSRADEAAELMAIHDELHHGGHPISRTALVPAGTAVLVTTDTRLPHSCVIDEPDTTGPSSGPAPIAQQQGGTP